MSIKYLFRQVVVYESPSFFELYAELFFELESLVIYW